MAALPPPMPPAPPPAQAGPHRFAALRTVMALVLREMSTRYGRTPGGYAWAILEPLGAILVLSFAFSMVMRTPPLGTSFILFYATGFMPFDLYQTVSNTVARAVNFSKPLLKYPAVTWLDAALARFLLNSLTGILVTILLLSGILAVIDSRIVLDLPPVVEAMALAMLLGLSVGVLNCALMGLFPLWEMIWSILTRPLFIASGIFFLYDTMPPLAQEILWYNPLMHIVGLMRTGFYPTYTASYVSHVYVLGVSLALLTMGLILMGRYHRDILNR
ncbi:ABC transporter permease [Antarcticimicrobium sediminis]|uniref:Transport permease protein n=1 Tax=Antarcticimicrobium sediminis TaxID=2546227 RepID=A0A4R5EIN2_9RHOB|nr:ABC transporter permease [Antarcticimicrobium sediminis]TDE34244.1 sugar ABC transporter permease [Antarcticimicrobium sediminis]